MCYDLLCRAKRRKPGEMRLKCKKIEKNASRFRRFRALKKRQASFANESGHETGKNPKH